jgi:hypothetical protein
VVRGGLVMDCPLVVRVAWMYWLVSMVQWGHGAGTSAHRDCGRTWRLQGASRQLAGAVEDAVWSVAGW